MQFVHVIGHVLPDQIIEIPLSSNLSWLRLFYALPRELVEKRPE